MGLDLPLQFLTLGPLRLEGCLGEGSLFLGCGASFPLRNRLFSGFGQRSVLLLALKLERGEILLERGGRSMLALQLQRQGPGLFFSVP